MINYKHYMFVFEVFHSYYIFKSFRILCPISFKSMGHFLCLLLVLTHGVLFPCGLVISDCAGRCT